MTLQRGIIEGAVFGGGGRGAGREGDLDSKGHLGGSGFGMMTSFELFYAAARQYSVRLIEIFADGARKLTILLALKERFSQSRWDQRGGRRVARWRRWCYILVDGGRVEWKALQGQ